MITPWEAFIQWFDSVPVPLRKYLAHIFRVCTTDDTTHLVASAEQSLENFRGWLTTMDFPLRVAARVFYVRSVFDMVLFHHKELLSDEMGASPLSENGISLISDRQWAVVLESWKSLRTKEMSDTYIHSWTSHMIKLQLEVD